MGFSVGLWLLCSALYVAYDVRLPDGAHTCGAFPWPCFGAVRQIEEGPTMWGLLRLGATR
ncbi:hypothetical protein AERO8C_20262 [Aeromonas veronii]|uniref:Uncharacterized protein n=1 Tax=Aeromonas veronii TaxID=654 RepID=A0A653L2G5_AERVE|nr:hypothetical protein AERO8C_20262 [Aeromonas veronii]